MVWTVDYTDTARKQLRELDKPTARRIVDFMDERIGTADDPRSLGKALRFSALRRSHDVYR